MAYTPTVWVNNQAPALNATNLNKLTDELEAQASETGVIHSLPTWANGVAPALTDAAPLNEIERVVQAVAAAVSLTYTPTVWENGWTPARNATRFNRLEVQAAANRAAIDSGGVGTEATPLGHLSNNFAGYWPPTNVADYSIVAAYGNIPSAFTGLALRYMTGVTVGNGANNISSAVAQANGWVQTVGGVAVQRQDGIQLIADPGNTAYRQAFVTNAITKMAERGHGGIWIDDMTPRINHLTEGSVFTDQYPNNASYETALRGLMTAIKTGLDAVNKKCAYNTAIAQDNNAALATAWWQTLAGRGHYLTCEFWMSAAGAPAPGIRKVGAEWYNNWNGFRALHSIAQDQGFGFLPVQDLSSATESLLQRYTLGTFMLDWDGTLEGGASLWEKNVGQEGDPWNTYYAQAVALGSPTADPTSVGNVWTRQFEGGSLQVDSANATTAITVT